MDKACVMMLLSLPCLLPHSAVAVAPGEEMRTLSSAVAEDIGKAGMKAVAVVDFTDLQGNITELGRFLAEDFAVELMSAAKRFGFELIDRTHLNAILSEHKLSM